MKNLSRSSLFILFLACLSGSLWLGSYVVKLFVSYRLFEETGFVLRGYLNESNLSEIFKIMLPLFLTSFVLYMIFIITFILFVFVSGLKFKKNGWLFIITLLVIITFPFEAYLMNIDYKIIWLISNDYFNSSEVIELITKRFKIFSSFSVIEVFCYFAIIFLLIFKPLTKEEPNPAV